MCTDLGFKHQIYTYSGKLCSVDDPPNIEDILVSLGRIARFSGNTIWDFNVFAHSIHVAYILWVLGYDHLILQGLVHDATECMFGDIPTPFKNKATRDLEKYAATNIFRSQNYNFECIDPVVSYADKISLVMEARLLLQGDAWSNILDNIEIIQKDVDLISDNFLEETLIRVCNDQKELFRPGNKIYSSTLKVIHKLRSLTKFHGDAFRDYLEDTFRIETI